MKYVTRALGFTMESESFSVPENAATCFVHWLIEAANMKEVVVEVKDVDSGKITYVKIAKSVRVIASEEKR